MYSPYVTLLPSPPLRSVLSPIPLSGNNRETFDSLIKTSRSIQHLPTISLSFNFLFQLPFAIRIPSPFVVSSIPFVPPRFLATGRRVDAWTTKGRRKGLEEKENRISRDNLKKDRHTRKCGAWKSKEVGYSFPFIKYA